MERKEIIKDPKKVELRIGWHGALISHEHVRAGAQRSELWLGLPLSHPLLSPIPTEVSSGVEGAGSEPLHLLALVTAAAVS